MITKDACADSAHTPHDYITDVQKRLGNSAHTGFGQCRLCRSFLDSQLEHGGNCSTAEASRGRGSKRQESIICTTRMSRISGFYHLDYIGQSEATQASVLSVCVDHSQTLSLSTEKPCSTAEATREHDACFHAVFGGLEPADPYHRAQRTPAELFHFRCCRGTERGSGRACGILECNSSRKGCNTSSLRPHPAVTQLFRNPRNW